MDEAGEWVYFSGTRDGPTETHVYRVRATGGAVERLTDQAGTHSPKFNKQLSLFVDAHSDIQTPSSTCVRTADGTRVREIEQNFTSEADKARVREYTGSLTCPEFLQIPTRDGFVMESMLIKPPGFDPSKRYPVLLYQYSGPHHPQVRNAWGGGTLMWHHYLAQQGYVVWYLDCRTSSGKGAVSTWPLHRNFGHLELADIEDGVSWLSSQPWCDPTRVGLWGWSYGGYMTLFALTHSTKFKCGISGAPVTDWTLYDSIYTERYMGTPQSNPEGYKGSAVLGSAADLSGRLLLLHGTMDDNVHFQQVCVCVSFGLHSVFYILERINATVGR